jgi:tRNA pseudouridine38-40 synthase
MCFQFYAVREGNFQKLHPMAHRYFIKLQYDGSRYHGWQIQPNANSVQETLNKALGLILHCEIETTGCGRTDTGVHARQFYAHFDLDEPINNSNYLIQRLDAMRIPGILCEAVAEVPTDLHARFSATQRSYEYHVMHKRDPFKEGLAHHLFGDLNYEAMNAAAQLLIGKQDFSAFSKSNTQVHTNFCNVIEAYWEQLGNHAVFHISADRFLRNMVRAIVGTLIDIGHGKMHPEEMRTILASKNRSKAGTSVPAHGLYLTQIQYPLPFPFE